MGTLDRNSRRGSSRRERAQRERSDFGASQDRRAAGVSVGKLVVRYGKQTGTRAASGSQTGSTRGKAAREAERIRPAGAAPAEASVPTASLRQERPRDDTAIHTQVQPVAPAADKPATFDRADADASELAVESAPIDGQRPGKDDANVTFEALALPYATFACTRLQGDVMSEFTTVKDGLGVLGEAVPESYAAFLKDFCYRHVLDHWREDYLKCFDLEAMRSAAENNRILVSRTFPSDIGRLRQDEFLFIDGDRLTLFFGLAPESNQEGNALMLQQSEQGMNNAIADMQIEMQFERKEMKARTRRLVTGFALLALLLGLVGGAILDRKGGIFTNILNQFMVKKEEPVVEVEAEATPAATAEPIVPTYVSRLGSASFTAEVSSNGTARTSTTITDYSTGDFTVNVTEVLGPDDFASSYSKYTLDGTEACVGLQIDFASIKDETLEVVPQDAFQISMVGNNGERVEEYQLMDKAIAGSYGVAITDGSKKTYYKRYLYSEDIRYLVLSCYKDGARSDYYFALKYDDPNVTHEELKSGDKKTMVSYLKSKLAELGYYSGKINTTFDSDTVEAVKSAQADLGMEQTGIADNAFQQALYAK